MERYFYKVEFFFQNFQRSDVALTSDNQSFYIFSAKDEFSELGSLEPVVIADPRKRLVIICAEERRLELHIYDLWSGIHGVYIFCDVFAKI